MSPTIADSDLDLLGIARLFLGADRALSVQRLGAGLINTTFLVQASDGSYVLQRINPLVFPAPERIMGNLIRLQTMVETRSRSGVRLPAIVQAIDGHPYVRDAAGDVWRLMEHVYPSRVLDAVQTPEQAAEIGRTLGQFHRLAAEIEQSSLSITLPGFHDTPGYLAALDAILADRGGAKAAPAGMLGFIDDRRPLASIMDAALRQGDTKLRVVHGDPKIDNLLFAEDSDRALCLIDLDTVQPGLIHHDIGDCLRSCCNRRGEAAEAADSVCFDLDIAESILGAYAAQAGTLLSTAEVDLIVDAVRLIPFELGIRFLIDHLQGDRYFRVKHRGENLLKAQTQFALLADIEHKADDIQAIVAHNFRQPDGT
jgi:Ser/Thr protein kinase RdoA (MazF antagonist)